MNAVDASRCSTPSLLHRPISASPPGRTSGRSGGCKSVSCCAGYGGMAEDEAMIGLPLRHATRRRRGARGAGPGRCAAGKGFGIAALEQDIGVSVAEAKAYTECWPHLPGRPDVLKELERAKQGWWNLFHRRQPAVPGAGGNEMPIQTKTGWWPSGDALRQELPDAEKLTFTTWPPAEEEHQIPDSSKKWNFGPSPWACVPWYSKTTWTTGTRFQMHRWSKPATVDGRPQRPTGAYTNFGRTQSYRPHLSRGPLGGDGPAGCLSVPGGRCLSAIAWAAQSAPGAGICRISPSSGTLPGRRAARCRLWPEGGV